MKGIGVSPGIAVGKAILHKNKETEIYKKEIKDIEKEIEKLKNALSESKDQIKELYEKTKNEVGEDEAEIFRAHMMILDDPEIFGKAEKKIYEMKVNAEWALKEVSNMFVEIFRNMDNEYMRERAADIIDVTGRVINNLMGSKSGNLFIPEEGGIIVAKDLTPSDTAQMDKEKILGLITEEGGKTSHSAIMARSLEIPAVVGTGKEIESIRSGDILAFDGDEGTIHINPAQETLRSCMDKKEDYETLKNKLKSFIGKKSRTKDGYEVEISANIGTPDDMDSVLKHDAEGIGLYRTEFLYMDRDTLPTEDEQFEAYKKVAEKMEGKPVIIRTLDVGGDKDLPYLNLPNEENPFLGYRAIRICLDQTDIFKTQLRAIVRASAYGDIKLMFPMISGMEELKKAKKILKTVKEELVNEHIYFNENMKVGMMIEIPSAAIMSDIFAKEVDFFSIGTNDLIQYTTAVDRGNKDIAHLYNKFHPAVLRLIKIVVENGHKEGIQVGMCGESAGDPDMIPLLIGMGLDELSMSPVTILKARQIISELKMKEMEKKAQQAANCFM